MWKEVRFVKFLFSNTFDYEKIIHPHMHATLLEKQFLQTASEYQDARMTQLYRLLVAHFTIVLARNKPAGCSWLPVTISLQKAFSFDSFPRVGSLIDGRNPYRAASRWEALEPVGSRTR